MTLEELVVKISGDTSGLQKSFGQIAGIAGKAIAAASAAAAAGVAALAKSAIDSYADYEQLIGGVETLFKDSAGQLEAYANEAYKTAGLSANEYMETVTSFSASLLQSVGGDTAQAAEAANQALIDMSDNANKMGSSMESIQNAYQGFAKQNYTMLDNLKLGYGGTKEEMERLLADAEKISGVKYDISNLNDVYSAIHVIQTELGITGTTAEEAASTISGSSAMMKAAWQNLLTGIANENADFEGLIANFVDSVGTFMENIMPRVEVALGGIADLIAQLAPIIAEALPQLVEGILPNLLEAVVGLIDAIVGAIPTLLPTLIEAFTNIVFEVLNTVIEILPTVIDALIQGLTSIVTAISENLPQLTVALTEGLVQIAQSIVDNLPTFLEAFLQLLMSFTEAILQALPVIIEALPELIVGIVDFIISAIPQLIQAGIDLLVALVDALPEIISSIVAVLPEIIDGIINSLMENIPLIVQAGIDLLVALIQALPEIITQLVTAIPQIVLGLVDALVQNQPKMMESGIKLFVELIAALPEIIVEIVKAIPKIITAIVDAFKSYMSKIKQIGKDLIVGIFEGISNATQWLYDKLRGWCSNVLSWVKKLFGINSPSKKMMEDGQYMVQGLAKGITDNIGLATGALSKTAEEMEKTFKPNLTIPEAEAVVSYSQSDIDKLAVNPKLAVSGNSLGIEQENKLEAVLSNSNDNIINTLLQNTRQLIEAIEGKELSVAIGDDQIAMSAARGNNNFKRRTGKPLLV